MLKKIKSLISLDNPLRLLYHKIRAILANLYYRFPSKNMIIIGVTGTNGKTTTCNIIAKGLRDAGKKVFMFSTVNIIIQDEEFTNETKMTSPDVFELQRLLFEAKKAGCEIAVIETASHGIVMNRIWGLEYDFLVLTNITQDHLDLHKTMQNYVNTKLLIFKKLITYKRKKGIKKTAIINLESDYSDQFISETYDNLYTYGLHGNCNIKAININNSIDGISFEVELPGKNIIINSKLKGIYNVENLLAAIGVFVGFGISRDKIPKLIESIDGVPGRMQEVKNLEGIKIFIDYAHTADALEKVLENLRSIRTKGRIITVFGATGDRDRTKRPVMGEVVSKLSDIVILTQDDDYSEKTEDIISDVLPGISRIEGNDFWVITNREEAIRTSIMIAEKDDIILIAGKGDEHVMVTNKGNIEWHDKTIVENILKGLDDNKIIQ